MISLFQNFKAMKKVLFVFALLAIGVNSFAYVEDDGGGSTATKCDSEAGSNNGRCAKKTKGGTVEYFCADKAWYQVADCIK